jgi:hypothetical protein
MQRIINESGQQIAYIRNNIIFNNENDAVVGIKIGDCCFGRKPLVIGKIIQGKVYLLNGEITGICQSYTVPNEKFASREQLIDAWGILSNISDHTCPWIITTEQWSGIPLLDHLK